MLCQESAQNKTARLAMRPEPRGLNLICDCEKRLLLPSRSSIRLAPGEHVAKAPNLGGVIVSVHGVNF